MMCILLFIEVIYLNVVLAWMLICNYAHMNGICVIKLLNFLKIFIFVR